MITTILTVNHSKVTNVYCLLTPFSILSENAYIMLFYFCMFLSFYLNAFE